MNVIPRVDERRLMTLVNDPGTTSHWWADRAACVDQPHAPDAYFPEEGELPPLEALARCVRCRVVHECLATALVHEAQDELRSGWWGGRSPEEREALAARVGIRTQQGEVDLLRPADLARILRTQNRTVSSIAVELGCTERTVYRYLTTAAA